MKRFTIRRKGMIMGTYPGVDEDAALDALARDEGFKDRKDLYERKSIRRDDHALEEIKE